MHKKLAAKIGIALVLIVIAIFVWPTRYSYDHLKIGQGTYPIRTNRFTGHTDILRPTGWQPMKAASETSTEDELLPTEEISKLKINPELTNYGYLKCHVYNGSEWELKELTGQFTILNFDGSVAESRKYRMHRDLYSSGVPYQSSEFSTNLDLHLVEGQKWSFTLIEAKGRRKSS